jgi:hypothetical protein
MIGKRRSQRGRELRPSHGFGCAIGRKDLGLYFSGALFVIHSAALA